eukprot:TRINITY_DN5271_c0_g1_i1.p1 TRINITY_DN5271_c0_g1~~TRINITY_DN5271_c0_g1_i1.p1  ORF type:complete len:657 (-),score=137.03 TRINITY_DN5271_c0_g1_i1:146-2116(-)
MPTCSISRMSHHAQSKQSGDEAKAGNEINRMIEALLKNKSLPLQVDDFDVRAKQVLHAISHKGGREQVSVALSMVGAFAEKKTRQGVQNWSAYVGAILRRFLNDFEVQMKSGDARDKDDDRVNSWEFKSPTAAVALQPSSVAPSEATEKQSWTDAPSPAHHWQKGRQSPKEQMPDHNAWWKELAAQPQPPPPPRTQQGWQPSLAEAAHSMTPKKAEAAQRWSDAYDGPDAWYSDPWSSNGKWSDSGYQSEGVSAQNGWGSHLVAEGSPRSRRKSVCDQSSPATMTSRRASFGGFPAASANTYASSDWDTHDGARSGRKSISDKSASEKTTSRRASFGELPATQADACGSPKRKPRMSLQSPKAQGETCESPKRKPRMSVAGASPSKAKNEDAERKPRKSLNGSKQWVPKAVPTLASMLQPKLTQKSLDRQLTSWVKLRGLSPSDAKVIALCDGEVSGRQLASVMLRGNECLVELDAPAGSAKHVVIGAWTRSAWPELKNSISSAVQACAGQSFTEFIGALWLALPVPEVAVEGSRESCEAEQSFQTECPASSSKDSFIQDAVQCTAAAMDQSDDLPDQSCARQFALWLNDRQPLLRLSQGDSTIAWDFPLSKAEKKEYLFLTTAAECNELREENADLKASEAALLNEIEFCSLEKS